MVKSLTRSLQQPFQGITPNNELAFWGSPVLTNAKGELYCPGFTGNTYSNNPWDYIDFALPLVNHQTPGICKIICPKHRATDRKKSAGTDGARITVHGLIAADVQIHVKLWTPEQYRQMMLLWQILFPGPQNVSQTTTGGPNNAQHVQGSRSSSEITRPFQVSHPQLKESRINTLVFTGSSGPEESEPTRARVFTMYAVEYFPPDPKKKATSTPFAAVATIGTALDPALPGAASEAKPVKTP